MAARAIWKARIAFGKVEVPVKLYSALQAQGVSFRLLDAKKKEPVKQHLVNPNTGKVVEYEDVRRALPMGNGELVILDPEELEELQPKPSRDIEITRFVDPEDITHQWYDRPYYLGPDTDGVGAYFALHAALEKRGKVGIARWVMRDKEYVGALRVEGDYLMLITLRHAGEVIPASALEAPGGRPLDKREIAMAKQLVAAMEDDKLDIASFKDEYRERVIELVEAKAAGKIVKFPKAKSKPKSDELADVLERSLAAAKKGRKSA
jgi:DNA end-binding protein Ku